MLVHRGNIVEVIDAAWKAARDKKATGKEPKDIHSDRSEKWVDALACEFKKRYCGKRHKIFWRGNDRNKTQFRKNEFLFDVVVCSVSETKSLQRSPKPLEFIAECHWLIESELNRKDTREIIIDMSKLVMGSATHKLFVAAHRDGTNRDILEQVSELAGRCGGHVYFAFVAHPKEWGGEEREPRSPEVYEWVASGWEPLPSTVEVR